MIPQSICAAKPSLEFLWTVSFVTVTVVQLSFYPVFFYPALGSGFAKGPAGHTVFYPAPCGQGHICPPKACPPAPIFLGPCPLPHCCEDSIFHTPGGIGCQPGAFGRIECRDAFDQPDGPDGDQILLICRLGIIFFHNMGHQAQVAFDQHIPGIQISRLGQSKITAFFFRRQWFWKTSCRQGQRTKQGIEHQPCGEQHLSSPHDNCILPCLSSFRIV